MCILRAHLWGTPMRRQDTGVSRKCFTRRLTVGIAKGVPMLCNGHKKTDGSVGMVVVYIPRREVTLHYNTKVVTCQIFLGSSMRLWATSSLGLRPVRGRSSKITSDGVCSGILYARIAGFSGPKKPTKTSPTPSHYPLATREPMSHHSVGPHSHVHR